VASNSNRGSGLSDHQQKVRAKARKGQPNTATTPPQPRNGKRNVKLGSTTRYLKVS
jgi:hypothetical protein